MSAHPPSQFDCPSHYRFGRASVLIVVAIAVGLALVVLLVSAGAAGPTAIALGLIAAPLVVLLWGISRGMPIERVCGLAIIAMLTMVAILLAVVLAVLIYAGGGVDIGN